MKKTIQNYLILFLLFFSSIPVYATFSDYKIRRVSPPGGLGINGQRDVRQDHTGFIWVITVHDLFRFDGYTFKRYNDKLNTQDSQSWGFYRLEIDSKGNIYVATTLGLLKYNPLTDNFDLISSGHTFLVKEDAKGRIWIWNEQLGYYNADLSEYSEILSEEGGIKNVSAIFTDKRNIYIGTERGEVYILDNETLHLKQVFQKEDYKIVDITCSEESLYILSENSGMLLLNTSDFKKIKEYDFFYPHGDRRVSARSVYIDRNGYVWITGQRGIYILDPVSGQYIRYQYDKTDLYGMPSSSVWRISEDNEGNLWFGTYSGGLCFIDLNEQKSLYTFNGLTDGLSFPLVSSFAEQGKYLWIGTEGGGLNRYDTTNNTFLYFQSRKDKNSLSYDNIQSLLFSDPYTLWIGMSRGGLDRLDTRTGTFTNFSSRNNPNSLVNDHVAQLVLQGDSGIWIKYMMDTDKITYISLQNMDFIHINLLPYSANRTVRDIMKGNGDTLWVAFSTDLLILKSKGKGVISSEEIVPITLPEENKTIQTIFADNENDNIWMGMTGGYLYMYNVKANHSSQLADLSVYGVYSIYSLNMDDEENVWLGTDNGLFRYNPQTGQLYQFNAADGAQETNYYNFSTLKSLSGLLYFGGNQGFTAVDPKRVTHNNYKPYVILSEFFLDNVPITSAAPDSPLKDPISETSFIKLAYDQNNFGFEFSSSNYLNPEKNRFRYRLKGYDNRYYETDATHRIASYAKVPKGNYVFQIMTANNDGEWGKEKSVEIHVQPAPWLTMEAICIYIIFFLLLLYASVRYYNNQRKQKLQRYWEKKQQEQKDEYHREQLMFFTNVSHDFRTPLSLISAAVESIKRESGSTNIRYLTILENNTRRLLLLVNELMDFRSLQNNKVKLKVESGDWNQFVRESSSDFYELAKQKNITFKILFDEKISANLCFDKKVMEKIILNLLNNAFKYTSDNGNGEITLQTLSDIRSFESQYNHSYTVQNDKKEEKELFGLVISDNGVGITANSINRVFDRYYRVSESGTPHLGSGIGLALVNRMIALHKGVITLYSERDKGTDIIIGFPVDPVAYDVMENVSDDPEITLSDNSLLPEIIKERHFLSPIKPVKDLSVKNNKHILLVEDNQELRELLFEMLSGYYDVIEAENGALAWELLEEENVDLVISDIMMPEIDGIELCCKVKDTMDTSHIPVILLTARSGMENKIEGLFSGADAYLEKPVNDELLLLNINNLFSHQEKIKEFYSRNFFMENKEPPGNKKDTDFMERFTSYIEGHITDTDVNQIASALAMSRRKLYSKVKTLTGRSVVDFIRNYRLQRAAQMLIREDISISTVMECVGIDNPSYFSRIFKNTFGESPSEFITKRKKQS